jgi:hypothetical protein
MLIRSLILASLIGAVGLSSTMAQVHIGVRRPYGGWHPYGNWWGGINYSGPIGVTPAESYARGQAETLRAQGEAYKNAAAGMVSYEQARSEYIKNQEQWLQLQAERRQYHDQKAAADRAQLQRRLAAPRPEPVRLTDAQFDRSQGTLEWPALLQAAAYEADRKQLEELVGVRHHTGDAGAVSEQIITLAKAMQTKLKGQIREVDPHQYLDARKFLDALVNEARSA